MSGKNQGYNSQGNKYTTPGGTNSTPSTAYHYSNNDGSYYYKNDNGSTYHQPSSGTPSYTAPKKWSVALFFFSIKIYFFHQLLFMFFFNILFNRIYIFFLITNSLYCVKYFICNASYSKWNFFFCTLIHYLVAWKLFLWKSDTPKPPSRKWEMKLQSRAELKISNYF